MNAAKEKLGKEAIELMIANHFIDARNFSWDGDSVEFIHQGHAQAPDAELLVEEIEACKHTIAYHQGQVDYASKIINMLMVGEGEEGDNLE